MPKRVRVRSIFAQPRLRNVLASSVSASVLIAAPHALAQQAAAPQTAAAAAGPTQIQEIVVTAEKRSQSLQTVPVAVSAFTDQQRTLLGVNTVEDLARFTPSVSYTNNDRMSIRGLGRLTNDIGTDPSVAAYSDGVFTNSMADASTPPIFIDRVEVLRGPQGTLYGRNSIGGALNVISKRPTDDFEGEIRAMGGNYGSWRTDILLRGPLAPHLRFLIGGSVERRDQGFIKNEGPAGDTGALKRDMVEAQIEADLGEHVVARVRYTHTDWGDSYGVGNTLFNVISPFDTTSLVGVGDEALYYNTTYGYKGANPATSNPYQINTNYTAYGTLKDNRIQADVTWDMGGATLKYLGGFQSYDYTTGYDANGTPTTAPQNILVPTSPFGPFTATGVSTDERTFYEERQSWFSNELDLSSSGAGPVQWIAGLFQYHQTYDQPQGISVAGDPSILHPLTLAGTPSAPNPSGAFLYVDGHLVTNSYAVFGQVDWKITPSWKLTGGLRYTYDEKSGDDVARYVARLPSLAVAFAAAGVPISVAQSFAVDVTSLQVCGATTVAGCAANPATANIYANPGGGLARNLSGHWGALTGTAGLQWEPDRDTNLYLRYSRGYKSGGWLGSNGLVPNPYAAPEYINAYELGAKKRWNPSLQTNASLFYYDYKGFQTPLYVPLGSIVAQEFLNLNARVWGFEFEGQWFPVDHLQVFANYSYLNSQVTSGCCFLDLADPTAVASGARPAQTLANGTRLQTLVGNPLPLAPKNKFTIGVNYTWDVGSGTLTASGTFTYTGDQQSTIFRDPIYTAPSNEIADFRLLWNPSRNVTLIGFVKNAFDQVAYQSSTVYSLEIGQTAVGPRQSVILNYPRTFGAEVQYRF